MNEIYLLILGMALVTYFPRFLPFLLVSGRKLPPKFEEFLGYIPYAALGSLIIPGFLNAIPEHEWVAVIGMLVACTLAAKKDGVVLSVLGAIGACILLLRIGW